MNKTNLFPVFDIIQDLLDNNYFFKKINNKYYLLNDNGESVVFGNTFRELCINIIMSDDLKEELKDTSFKNFDNPATKEDYETMYNYFDNK